MKNYRVSFLTGTAAMLKGLEPWNTDSERDYDAIQGGIDAESEKEAISLAIEYLTEPDNRRAYNGGYLYEYDVDQEKQRVILYDGEAIIAVYYDFKAE